MQSILWSPTGLNLLIFEDVKTTTTAIAEKLVQSIPGAPKEITVEATAYTATCEGYSGIQQLELS